MTRMRKGRPTDGLTKEEKLAHKRDREASYSKEWHLGLEVNQYMIDPGIPGIEESGCNRFLENLGNGSRHIRPRYQRGD